MRARIILDTDEVKTLIELAFGAGVTSVSRAQPAGGPPIDMTPKVLTRIEEIKDETRRDLFNRFLCDGWATE